MSEIDTIEARAKQKRKVINLWSELIVEVELYLEVWKRFGGGTTGHAIGCAIYRLNYFRTFFKSYC
jgi:hypothetical protein